jgi:hypothetical protein
MILLWVSNFWAEKVLYTIKTSGTGGALNAGP